jgi:hypothetical protein
VATISVPSRGLHLDWASYEAAKFATTHWHYAGTVPPGKTVKVGVWEDGRFRGVVIFSYGAVHNIGSPYGLKQVEVCELVRVALDEHRTPTTRIVAIAIRKLRQLCPGIRLIVSYADEAQGHLGKIYQAGGWIYTGHLDRRYLKVNGKVIHPRTLGSRYGKGGQAIEWIRRNLDPMAVYVRAGRKHKYLMPLDAAMRRQLAPLAKPFPKQLAVEA